MDRQFEVISGAVGVNPRVALSNLPVVLFAFDADGVCTLSEGDLLHRIGLSPGEVVGRSFFDIYGGYPDIVESIHRALAGEAFGTTADVSGISFETYYRPLRNDADVVVGGIGLAIDVTQRVEAEQALVRSEGLRQSLLTAIPDRFLAVSSDGTILAVKPGRYDTDLRPRTWLRRSLEEVMPDGVAKTLHELVMLAMRSQRVQVLEHAEGDAERRRYYESRVVPSVEDRAVVIERDVTERTRLQQQLLKRAHHDPLTGLANRTLLRHRLEQALTHADDGHVAVLFFDLDRFKAINDTYGHQVGDQLLVAVGTRAAEHFPLPAPRTDEVVGRLAGDAAGLAPVHGNAHDATSTAARLDGGSDDWSEVTAARLGGDEFAVLLTAVRDRADVAGHATTLARALREPFSIDGQRLQLGVSIGIAHARPGDDADDVLRDADVAMYSAKHAGVDQVECTPSMRAAAIDRATVRRDLDVALDRGQLQVEYQPIVDLTTGELEGLEALSRWIHPTRGRIGPSDFVPVAEESGAITRIGEWVLTQACTALTDLPPIGREPYVAVNVSGVQLRRGGLRDIVLRALDQGGRAPEHLCLELTETHLLTDLDDVMDDLRRLTDDGVRLAVDDFGTGQSSFTYLRRLPLTTMKIDRSIVAEAGWGRDGGFAAGLIALAQRLGLRTVAEGIETPEQARLMAQLGCDGGQGNLFGLPRPRAQRRVQA